MKQMIFLMLALFSHQALFAHCQIPCGIYHDQMVVQGLEEDIETLRKSVKKIQENPRKTPEDFNQLTRWVINKEKHADKLSETLVEYFLKQRIKSDAEQLDKKLTTVHNMLLLSMKIKQTVNLEFVDHLQDELKTFIVLMYEEKEQEQAEHHHHEAPASS